MKPTRKSPWWRACRFWDTLFRWSELAAALAQRRLAAWLRPAAVRGKPRQARPDLEALEYRYALSTVQVNPTTFSDYENVGNSSLISINLDVAPTGTNVTVHYATSDITAAAGTDYTSTSGTLTFTPTGPTAQAFQVPLLDDSLYEGDRTFLITLSNVTGGYTLGASTATFTIHDNDPTPTFRFSTATYSAGEGAGTATITVERVGATAGSASVDYATSNGSATAGSDYTGIGTTTLNFANGQVTATFTVTVLEDSLVEGDESLTLSLSNPSSPYGINYGQDSATLTIVDNDQPTFRFSTASYSVGEGAGLASVTVERVGSSSGSASVQYATSDGTAAAGSDYSAASGTLNFSGGQTSTYFTFTVTDDSLVEGDESLNLSLSSPSSGYGLGLSSATLTIVDNDVASNFRFSTASYGVSEGVGLATVTVERTGSTAASASVNYSTSNGTATAGSDYTGIGSATLNFSTGQATATFSVTVTDDSLVEFDEYLNLSLANPSSGYGIDGSLGSATLTIRDNDAAGFALANGPPPGSLYVPVGPVAVSPDTGALKKALPLDAALSVADCGCGGTAVPTPESLALVYQSGTTAVKPVIQVTFPSSGLPTAISAQLTWNGSAQGSVSFSPSGHSAGDTYLLALQVGSAVSSTGNYAWSVDVQLTYGGLVVDRIASGTAAVVVNDSSPFGAGWTLAGLDHLFSVTGGVLYVHGSGAATFFADLGSGSYLSPAGDFGTLTAGGGGYTYTDENKLVDAFDGSGLLLSVTDPNGLARTFAYTSATLNTVTEPDGGVATFSYSGGKLVGIQEPGGRALSLTQSGGDLTALQDADGSLHTFSYSGHKLTGEQWGGTTTGVSYDGTTGAATAVVLDGLITASYAVNPVILKGLGSTAGYAADAVGTVTDPLGHTTSYTLDAQGRATGAQTAAGGWTTLRDASGNVTVATDPFGAVTTYQYSYAHGKGDLVEIDYPSGAYESFAYDATYHRLTGHRDTQNHLATYTYSGTGDLLTATDAPHHTTTNTWSGGREQTSTDPLGNVTSYTYDGNLRVQTVTVPGGGVYTFGYDAAGNRQTVTDPLNHTTTTLYDALRRVTATVDALSGTATNAYDALGHVSSTTDALGHRTDYSYDSQGRLSATTAAAGTGLAKTTTNLYDLAGNVTGVQDANGHLTQYLYDAANRLTVTVDALSHRTTTQYDAAGHVTGTVDANGNATQYLFDTAGRQTVVIDAQSHRTTSLYDARGNVTEVIDPNSHPTLYLYNSDDRLTVTVDALGGRTTTLFDGAGNVTEVIDANSHPTLYLYDANNRLSVTVDALGNRATSLFDAHGNVTGTLDAGNHLTQYLFDAAGRQTVVVDALSHRTTTLFDSVGNVTEVIDANSHPTLYLFDALNRQTVVIDALGNRTTSLLDAAGHVTGTQDARGNLTQYLFDALNRQSVVIDAQSRRTTTLFDAQGNVTEVIDPNSHPTQYLFDALNRQTVVIDALGNRTTTVFDAQGNVTETIDALSHPTQYLFDTLNRSTVTIDPLNHRTTSLFDAAGNMTGVQDARGNLTQYLFDALNRASVSIDGDGGRTTTLWDAAGHVTGVKDADNHLTQYLLDAGNRATVTVYADGLRTTAVYDAAGNVTAQTDLYNRTTTYLFDALNRVTLAVDSTGRRTTSLYDAAGNLTGSYDFSANLLQYQFDALNRVSVSIDGNSKRTTTTFDQVGNVTGVRVDGNLTQYLFDAVNRQTVTVNPLNFRTTNLFDAAGNVTQVTDGQTGFNNVSTFAYDALNRVTSQTDPLSHTATFAYNAVGLLTEATDRLGRRRAYHYDADDRVTGQTWYASGGGVDQRLTFTYDNGGNQLTAVNAGGTYTMGYDALNRVTVVNEPFSQTLTFTYDARGHRTVVQDSQGGVTTSAYDDSGMFVERDLGGSGQPSLRVDLSYNEQGQNDGVTRYNDLAGLATQVVAATSLSYDVQGRVTNLHHVQGVTNRANYTYTYDAQGRVTSEVRNGTATTYSYDAADQLTGDGTNTVTYDGTGNRTNGSNTPGAGNQLTTDGTWTYTYDLEGNETKKSQGTYAETWEYGYDQENHLLSARRWSADSGPRSLLSEVDFTYDAFGDRIEKAVDSNGDGTVDTTQRYTLDGWNPAKGAPVGLENYDVLFDLNGSNVLQARYLRGDVVDQLFARVDKSGATYTPYWTLTDHLGSVRDVTDNGGAVQGTVVYDGFGNATLSGSNTAAVGRYRFTGREYDAETKLQYNRARYYDAGTGRWISQDPLGFDAGDSNLYRYVNNCSQNRIDPSGMNFIAIGYTPIAQMRIPLGIVGRPERELEIIERDIGGHLSLSWFDTRGQKNPPLGVMYSSDQLSNRLCFNFTRETTDLVPDEIYQVNKGWYADDQWVRGFIRPFFGTVHLGLLRKGNDNVSVSVIRTDTQRPLAFVPIFTGDNNTTDALWTTINKIAETYKYAERWPGTPGKDNDTRIDFKRWPESRYPWIQEQLTSNNSNTFVRYVLQQADFATNLRYDISRWVNTFNNTSYDNPFNVPFRGNQLPVDGSALVGTRILGPTLVYFNKLDRPHVR